MRAEKVSGTHFGGRRFRKGQVNGEEWTLFHDMPGVAVLRTSCIRLPAHASGIEAAGPPFQTVGSDLHDLILVGNFIRANVLVQCRAARGEHRQVRVHPVDLAVVGVAVKEEIQRFSKMLLQQGCVPEVLVISDGVAMAVVMDDSEPEHTLFLGRVESRLEPPELGFAHSAEVSVFFACNEPLIVLVLLRDVMDLGDGRVESRDHK